MTDIDTAAIRAAVARNEFAEPEDTLALCDALDEARMDTRDMDEYDARWFALHAELDAARDDLEDMKAEVFSEHAWGMREKARADAAEARIDEFVQLCYDNDVSIGASAAAYHLTVKKACARAEEAEARIAAAYDISQQWPDGYQRRQMFCALTGDK